MKLSILTPAITERINSLEVLRNEIARQALPFGGQVEHIIDLDERGQSKIGAKRTRLLNAANGEYIAFCDDDDFIKPDYISRIMEAISIGVDLVTFRQEAYINGVEYLIEFGAHYSNEDLQHGAITRRSPFHVCVWKREIILDILFPSINYGEDWEWAKEAISRVRSYLFIPEILHEYHYSDETTAAHE